MTDTLLSMSQVLWALGDGIRPLPRSTFDRWKAVGKAPKVLKLPNGQIRVRQSELDKFLVACEV